MTRQEYHVITVMPLGCAQTGQLWAVNTTGRCNTYESSESCVHNQAIPAVLGDSEMVFETYSASILALGAIAALMFVQLIIADVLGILRKNTPGTSVAEDHSNSLFRVTRTVANVNESIAIFICAFLFCIFSGASPEYTAYSAWAFVAFRVLYAVFYYANVQVLRSVCFGFSAIAIAALLILGVLA